MKRISFIGAMAAILLCSTMYTWSIFVPAIEENLAINRSDTALIFSMAIVCFSLGAFLTRSLLRWLNFKKLLFSMASLAFLGLYIASLPNYINLILGFGVLLGFSSGVIYNLILSNVIPQSAHPGISSGILMMSFGMGGVILGNIAKVFIDSKGYPWVFRLLGVLFAIVISFTGLWIDSAPFSQQGQTRDDMKGKEKEKILFAFLWITFLCSASLIIIGHGSLIYSKNFQSYDIYFIVGWISLANGIGRLFIGWILDRFSLRRVMPGIGFFYLFHILTMVLSLGRNEWMFIMSLVGLAMGFGFLPATQSVLVTKLFHPKQYTRIFGLLTLNMGPSSFLGPYIAGRILWKTQSDHKVFLWMLVLTLASFIPLRYIRKFIFK